MDSLTLIIAILATWRLSAMLSYEAGPFNVFIEIRELAGIIHDDFGQKNIVPPTFWAELLDCVWCLSVWIGAFVAVLVWLNPVLVWLFLPFALSAGAIIVEKINHG